MARERRDPEEARAVSKQPASHGLNRKPVTEDLRLGDDLDQSQV